MGAGAPARCLFLLDPSSTFPLMLQRLGRHLLALRGTAGRLMAAISRDPWTEPLTLLLLPVGEAGSPPGHSHLGCRRDARSKGLGAEWPHLKEHCVGPIVQRRYSRAREGKEGHCMSQWSSMDWGPEAPAPCPVHSCSLVQRDMVLWGGQSVQGRLR